jgi:hypothetical protein
MAAIKVLHATPMDKGRPPGRRFRLEQFPCV